MVMQKTGPEDERLVANGAESGPISLEMTRGGKPGAEEHH